MTQEEKQLLIKDLCARLPYGVMCKIQTRFVFEDGTLRRGSYDKILDLDTVTEINEWKETGELEKFKPYLRQMSSMTEEEKEQFEKLTYSEHEDFVTTTGRRMILATDSDTGYGSEYFSENISEVLDWLNAHHFDYRGLIEKGLAFEAPEGMYNI